MADHLNDVIRNTAGQAGIAGAHLSKPKSERAAAKAEKAYESILHQVNLSNLQGAARDAVLDKARSDLSDTTDINRILALVTAQIDKEILKEKDAEDNKQLRQELLADAAQQKAQQQAIEKAYSHIRLSAAAQRRIDVQSQHIDEHNIEEFAKTFVDEKDSPAMQKFEQKAAADAFNTESGKKQLEEYNKVEPKFKKEAGERREKAKALAEELSHKYPSGPVHDLLTQIQDEKAFRSKKMYDALGKLAAEKGSPEAISEVKAALELERQRKSKFLEKNSDQIRAAVHATGSATLDKAAAEATTEEIKSCSLDLQNGHCRKETEKDLEKVLNGKGQDLTKEERTRVVALAAEKGLEGSITVDSVIEDFRSVRKNINVSKYEAAEIETAVERSVQYNAIVGKMGGVKVGKHRVSVEDREEDMIKLIKSQPKYKDHKWTEKEEQVLRTSAKEAIAGIDEGKYKVQSVDLMKMFERGAGVVLHSDHKAIDQYANTINKAMKNSGYSQEFADNVTHSLAKIGHIAKATGVTDAANVVNDVLDKTGAKAVAVATKNIVVGSAKAVTNSVSNTWNDAKVNWNKDDDIEKLLPQLKKSELMKAVTPNGKKLFTLTGDNDKDVENIKAVLEKAKVDLTDYDRNKDGHISAAEFGSAARQAQKRLGAKEPANDHKTEVTKYLQGFAQTFISDGKGGRVSAFDMNHDGKVSVAEVTAMLKKANVNIDKYAGADGVLNAAEINQAIAQAAKNLEKANVASAKGDHHDAPKAPTGGGQKKPTQHHAH